MVQNNPAYLKTQAIVIATYLAAQKAIGDNRSDNEIVIDWITSNSENFRATWIINHQEA